MNNKYFKLIITFTVLLCMFSTSIIAYAKNVPDKFEEQNNKGARIILEKPTGEELPSETTAAPTTTAPPTTAAPTTAAPTTTRYYAPQTQAPRPVQGNNVTEEETSEETTLPEGEFLVYLDLGDGEEPKKHLMKEPGIIPEPQEPEREGYLFDGWYSNKKLTKEWDFSKDEATKEMTIYAKWVQDTSSIVYNITVVQADGGKITVRPSSATPGTPVTVAVTPSEGKRIVDGSLTINGKSSDVYTFKMPAEDVVIEAKFEDVPEVAPEEKDYSFIIVIAVAGVVVLGLIIVGIVMMRRRNEIIVPEFDENGAVIIEDDEEVWIDESIVIESAFPGKTTEKEPEKAKEEDEFTAPKIKINAKPVAEDIPVADKTKGMKDIANEFFDEDVIDEPIVEEIEIEDEPVADIPVSKAVADETVIVEEQETVDEPMVVDVIDEEPKPKQSAFINPPANKSIINENSSIDFVTDVFVEDEKEDEETSKGRKRIDISDIDFSDFE